MDTVNAVLSLPRRCRGQEDTFAHSSSVIMSVRAHKRIKKEVIMYFKIWFSAAVLAGETNHARNT